MKFMPQDNFEAMQLEHGSLSTQKVLIVFMLVLSPREHEHDRYFTKGSHECIEGSFCAQICLR